MVYHRTQPYFPEPCEIDREKEILPMMAIAWSLDPSACRSKSTVSILVASEMMVAGWPSQIRFQGRRDKEVTYVNIFQNHQLTPKSGYKNTIIIV